MPIIRVNIIGVPEAQGARLAQALADGCSPAFPPEHREVWMDVRVTLERDWAIGGGPVGGRPLPVFVEVVREVNPEGEDLDREIRGITAAVATATGRPPDSVHVTYEPSARGRMAFGGRLLR